VPRADQLLGCRKLATIQYPEAFRPEICDEFEVDVRASTPLRNAAIGVAEVRLYTNKRMERNIALYRRHGFIEVVTRPHPSRPGDVLVDGTPSNGGTISRTNPRRRLCGSAARRTGSTLAGPEVTLLLSIYRRP
jgi:hypothetical protein